MRRRQPVLVHGMRQRTAAEHPGASGPRLQPIPTYRKLPASLWTPQLRSIDGGKRRPQGVPGIAQDACSNPLTTHSLAPALIAPLAETGKIRKRARPTQRHRSEEHTSELQSPDHLVCRLLLEKKKNIGATQLLGTIRATHA